MINSGDAAVTEGHSGTSPVNFTVTLSAAVSEPVIRHTARVTGPRQPGAITSPPRDGGKSPPVKHPKRFRCSCMGIGPVRRTKLLGELESGRGNVELADSQLSATIVDDEPRVRINGVSKNEGNNGTTSFVFTVTLSVASGASVSVNLPTWTLAQGRPTTTRPVSGALDFAPGTTSRTNTVNVKGDRTRESEEVFYVNLSGATGAVIQSGHGTGVVRNDDR